MVCIENLPIFYKDNNYHYHTDIQLYRFHPTIFDNQGLTISIGYYQYRDHVCHQCDDIGMDYWLKLEHRSEDVFDTPEVKLLLAFTDRLDMDFHTANASYHICNNTYFCNSKVIRPVIFHYNGNWYIANSLEDYYHLDYDRIIDWQSSSSAPLTAISSLL